jgi:hypothetical protein
MHLFTSSRSQLSQSIGNSAEGGVNETRKAETNGGGEVRKNEARTEADKDLSRSERKNLYKEWREDEKLARERDQKLSL